MTLSNADRQRRWRDKRNSRAGTLAGKPKEIADGILRELGTDQAKKVVRALDKRLRNIKPDCRACRGTGIMQVEVCAECSGEHSFRTTLPCDCGDQAQAWLNDAQSNPIAPQSH
jgi:hypothetical protein